MVREIHSFKEAEDIFNGMHPRTKGLLFSGDRVFFLEHILLLPHIGLCTLTSESIEAIYILPSYRGQGYGSQLIRAALSFFPEGIPVYADCVTIDGYDLCSRFPRIQARDFSAGGLVLL